jgi:hypothetical protein
MESEREIVWSCGVGSWNWAYVVGVLDWGYSSRRYFRSMYWIDSWVILLSIKLITRG